MIRKKIAIILMIAVTATFASFFGGPVTYGLLYISIIIPLSALIYCAYVGVAFKPVQSVKQRQIEKGKDITYSVFLTNKSFLPFTNVRMIHYSDKKDIQEKGLFNNYCIVPKEEYEIISKITCPKRGVFNMGIKKVIVQDFLNVFRLSGNVHELGKVYVVPRLIMLSNIIAELDTECDRVRPQFSVINRQEVPDIDMRRYISGDNRKMIHWKASAKRHELYTRKYVNNPDPVMKIVVDLSPIGALKNASVETEDRILEASLAVMKFYQKKKKPATAVYADSVINMVRVSTENEFNDFYRKCAELVFTATSTVDMCMIRCLEREESGSHFVLVMNRLTDRVSNVCKRAIEFGNIVTVILVDDNRNEREKFETDLKNDIIVINKNQGISDVLERK